MTESTDDLNLTLFDPIFGQNPKILELKFPDIPLNDQTDVKQN